MPAHQLHIELAETIFAGSDHFAAPGWADDDAALNAFYHGAIGPDMGFFPGADTLLGGLAHYLRPGVLVAEMVARATSDVEHAYALGWATHLIADVEAHTRTVNRRAGELFHGTAGRPAVYTESPAAHLAVEIGLDAARLAIVPPGERIRLRPALDRHGVRFLADALAVTYDVQVPPATLLRSHRAVVRFQPMIFSLVAGVGRMQTSGPARPLERVARSAYRFCGAVSRRLAPRSRLTGVTNPDTPATWVESDIDLLLAEFPGLFSRHFASNFDALAEINVDTGEGGDTTSSYPYSVDTRRRLEKRRR